uniref:Reverse transcriptase zinc-binding domain-containing protein n=1 Tax=Cannabis sativa TaxID=3483 RepID=A0A803Q3L9_CANSA
MNWDRMCTSKDRGGMGFRHLHDFNIALLGKQAWRLHTRTNSLVGKIFKAKYFPRGSFVNATLGNNPSFVWRSILEAKDLIIKGGRILVGSGETISITRDPWLPDMENPFITSFHPSFCDKDVKCLLTMDGKNWDYEIINDLFNDRDKDLILTIPISPSNSVDTWYWSKEVSGDYSVKSAYSLIQDLKVSPSSSNSSGLWRDVWSLKIPPKVKEMLWRTLSNCLPTRAQLIHRHVPIDSSCPRCNREAESIAHCIVGCNFVSACWRFSGLSHDSIGNSSFGDWFQQQFQRWNNGERQMGAMLCWAIWQDRNNKVWNDKSGSVKNVVALARTNLEQWLFAQEKTFSPLSFSVENDEGDEQWCAPHVDYYKINVDALTFSDKHDSTLVGFSVMLKALSFKLDRVQGMGMWSRVSPRLLD